MARDKVCVVIGAGDATGGASARRFARSMSDIFMPPSVNASAIGRLNASA